MGYNNSLFKFTITDFKALTKKERVKDTKAMNKMLELIRKYDGLTIYRMK